MKIFGYWLIGFGIIYLWLAFNMDVTVMSASTYVPGYGSVGGENIANLDLMARRQNHLMVAALVTLIGALMVIFVKSRSESAIIENTDGYRLEAFKGEHDLASDAYKLWLVKLYQIERNEVFNRFVMSEQTFDTLDDALDHAHALEVQKIVDKKAEEERIVAQVAATREAARSEAEKADAAWNDLKPKLFAVVIIILSLIVVAYFFMVETSQERDARLVREKVQQVELVKNIEDKFGVILPKDVSGIEFFEIAIDYDFICNDQKNGKLLRFRTEITEEAVKKLFVTQLGKGEAEYGFLPGNFDWVWQKGKVRYNLSMLGEGPPPTEVNLCMTNIIG